MSKPELSEERIAELADLARENAASLAALGGTGQLSHRRFETTIALIESRKQALELLKETFGEIKVAGSMSIGLFERISNYLDENQ